MTRTGTVHRRPLALLAAATALVAVLAACGSVVPYAADVGGQRIGQDDLESELRAIAGNEEYLKFVESQTQVRGSGKGVFDAAFTAQVLTSQIVYQLVAEDLARRKIVVAQADLDAARPAVIRRVGGDGVFDAFTKDYQDTLVRRSAEVNALAFALQGKGSADDVARAYFKDNPAQFARTCASHILVPTAEQAAAIKARLDAGEDFATVARAESKDARSGAAGGDLGCFDGTNQLVPEFAKAAFSQPVNEVGAPVQTQFGFHLIQVASRTSPKYEEVAAQARDQAITAGRASLEEWFAGIVEKTKVSVNPRYGRFEKNGADSTVVPPQVPTAEVPGLQAPPTVPTPAPGP